MPIAKSRKLLEDALARLELINPEYDKEGPNYDLMMEIAAFLNTDNDPVHIASAPIQVPFQTFDKARVAIEELTSRTYPTSMVMLPELIDFFEAWNRFAIAWYG